MNIKEEFKEIVKEIQENEKDFDFSPREIISFFHYTKRTKGNNARIDDFLEIENLITIPDYKNIYIDGNVKLKHKEKAKSKSKTDPIQRISLLPSANKTPVTITRDAKLKEAQTLMMINGYSQLPVMSNPRTVAGFITWETIGMSLTNGIDSEDVKDFLTPDFTVLEYDTPLLEAIKTVLEKEYVLVRKKDKTISGIVTLADISNQFMTSTEPFLLLEQIENLIRRVLDKKFLIEELNILCESEDAEHHQISYIDDLTFGQYIRLIEKPESWDKLDLSIDRSNFIKKLDEVREIRNDVMHFDPEGITNQQKETLTNMANFLTRLVAIKKL
ncbi:CBS domain-containing protein [Wenyingzhuangia sp. 1_MG-2023]|nr:CBS domain-containing protein [Wenyingzhuangia sp. 1_MG-2023]